MSNIINNHIPSQNYQYTTNNFGYNQSSSQSWNMNQNLWSGSYNNQNLFNIFSQILTSIFGFDQGGGQQQQGGNPQPWPGQNVITKPTGVTPSNQNVYVGTSQADFILGSNTDDIIYASGNSPSGSTEEANDWDDVYAGGGNDVVIGGVGDDYLFGESGNDILKPGASSPFRTSPSYDVVDGGSDYDTLVLSGNPQEYQISYDGKGSGTATSITGDVVKFSNIENIQYEVPQPVPNSR